MKWNSARCVAALFLTVGSSVASGTGFGEVVFNSGVAEYDEAYRKALFVIAGDIKGNKFLAGEHWNQVWTRDTSYSIDLACKLIYPEVSKTTLLGLTEDVRGIGKVWIQDKCGHFGGWPTLTDAIVGATGAWSLYEFTGDRELLEFSYKVTLNSLKRAERDAFDSATNLFKGCSSFMESNSGYPKKYAYNGNLLAKTKALSTNLLYYNGYKIAAKMSRELGSDPTEFEGKAQSLKVAINQHFWMQDKGYYGYFEDENGKLYENMEGTGEAFAILFDLADAEQKQSILKNTPLTAHGIPSLWPQFPENKDYKKEFALYYHNGMIWPFVQGYWALAASTNKDLFTFQNELEHLTQNSQANTTFMEFYRPEDMHPDGSRSQLWSAAGYLSMIYHGLFGMDFGSKGITFAPVVPETFSTLNLDGMTYRNMKLSIAIHGHGTVIHDLKLDGIPQFGAVVPTDLTGDHKVTIEMGQ